MKTKRIVALLLALMLAVSVITISAYAEGDDDWIEPYGQVVQCPRCGNGAAVLNGTKTETNRQEPVSGCDKIHHAHTHTITRVIYSYSCKNCGSFSTREVIGNTCNT